MIVMIASFCSLNAVASHQLSKEISLKENYQYRLVTRKLATQPNKNFSDNVRPLAARESILTNRRFYSGKSQLGVLKPIQDIQLKAIHSNPNNPVNSNYGENFSNNNGGILNIHGYTSFQDILLFSHDTRIQYDQTKSELSLNRYQIKSAFSHISISYAKDSLLLGPGYFGNLFSSDNVQPYQIALVKTEVPYKIPIFGQFRWYLWHSWFNNDEPALADSKMLGIRFTLKPSKYFEFSLTRTSTYGGNGQNIDSFSKLSNVITAKDENAETDINTDQLVGIDASLYLPFNQKLSPFLGGKFYTEYVWNDIAAFWQTEDKGNGRLFELLGRSYLYGIYLTTKKLDFHFEYVNIARALYAHSTLGATGSSINGFLIGHFIGRDAEAFLSEVYYEWKPKIHFSVNAGRVKRLQRPSNNQFTKMYGLGIKYFSSQKIRIELSTRFIFEDQSDIDPSPINYNFVNTESSNWQSTISVTYRL